MQYIPPVYRPPSEARSLIVQVMTGCSHNQCYFCSMYKGKAFREIPLDQIKDMLLMEKSHGTLIDRIFLADGDALILSTDYLTTLLKFIKEHFPHVKRISTYATPNAILNKSDADLKMLNQQGLSLAYMGVESGSDFVLKNINKGVTARELIKAGQKIRRAGWQLSVTAISGLGGTEHWKEHALETAKVVSAIEPEYLGLLALMIEPRTPLEKWVAEGSFQVPDCELILQETQLLIENIHTPHTLFRNNHASNFFAFNGVLPNDRDNIVKEINEILEDKDLMAHIQQNKWRSL